MSPEAAAGAVASLRQGSVLELAGLPLLTSYDAPLHPEVPPSSSVERSDTGRVVTLRTPRGQVLLVSQTCDLQAHRTLAGRVIATVAPIVRLEGAEARDAERLTKPHFVPVPWLEPGAFADLDQATAVDRSTLATAGVIASPGEGDRRKLAYLLGRYLSRPALPDEVDRALVPIAVRAEGGKDAAVRRLFDEAVTEIRVLPQPEYADNVASHLTLYFVLNEDWYPDAEPVPFGRQLASGLPAVASAVIDLLENGTDSDAGKIVSLWRLFLDRITTILTDRLAKSQESRVSGFSLVPVTSLRPDEYAESDALDLGHLSLADDTTD